MKKSKQLAQPIVWADDHRRVVQYRREAGLTVAGAYSRVIRAGLAAITAIEASTSTDDSGSTIRPPARQAEQREESL